jgi:GNAT superfamily N-acetyltransferase
LHPHPDYTLRPFRHDDMLSVVALLNAASERALGIRRAVIDGAGDLRLARYVAPDSEKIVAVDAQDRPAGYLYLVPSERNILFEMGGAVHPDVWGCGVGTLLVERATLRAQELAKKAPAGVKALLQTNLFAAEQAAIRLIQRMGFTEARTWLHMAIELDIPPRPPDLPSSLLIRPMDLEQDWDLVGPAMDAAYADHWGAITLASDPADDEQQAVDADDDDTSTIDTSYSNAPGMCFIVLEGERVVGGILCNARLVERDDTGRVGSMFVRPEYRRCGIGRALILTAFRTFWQRGIRLIILDTDAQSFTAAPRFYAQVGMQPYRQEFLYERVVCPGRDVRRLEA